MTGVRRVDGTPVCESVGELNKMKKNSEEYM